jgi:hypothetical protein
MMENEEKQFENEKNDLLPMTDVKYQFLTKFNKLNLLNIILDFLKIDEMLKLSCLNKNFFNCIKNKYNKFLVTLLNQKIFTELDSEKSHTLSEYKILFDQTLKENSNIIIKKLYEIFSEKIFSTVFQDYKIEIKEEDLYLHSFIISIFEHSKLDLNSEVLYNFSCEVDLDECDIKEQINNLKNRINPYVIGNERNLNQDLIKLQEMSSKYNFKFQTKFKIIFSNFVKNKNFLPLLQELNLCNTKLNDEFLDFIFPIIKTPNKVLAVLNLRNNLFGTTGKSNQLLSLLAVDNTIESLEIQYNMFGENSVYQIISIYLSKENKIDYFDISNNKFPVESILNFFKFNPFLINKKELYLTDPNNFPSYSFVNENFVISFYQINKNSNQFNISKNEFSNYKKKVIDYLIPNKTQVYIYLDTLNENEELFWKYLLFDISKDNIFSLIIDFDLYTDDNQNEQNFISIIMKLLSKQKFSKLKFLNLLLAKENFESLQMFLYESRSEKLTLDSCFDFDEKYTCCQLYAGLKSTNIPHVKIKNSYLSDGQNKYLLGVLKENQFLKELEI